MDRNPPLIAERLLALFLKRKDHQAILGDFAELYQDRFDRNGFLMAGVWYWLQIFKSFPGFVISSLYWSLVMAKNYFKVTGRVIRRHKGFSLINMSGLAIGIASCLLISLWVLDELSYDRFHDRIDHLFRVEVDQEFGNQRRHNRSSPVPLAQAAESEIPEVEFATRFTRFGGMQLGHEERSFYESDIRAADPSFFKMFSFPLLKGDEGRALSDPFSIVLTPQMAEKYFGLEDPMGKVILAENQFELIVTGIISAPPSNSSLQYDCIIPFVFVLNNLQRMPEGWADAISNFVYLSDPGTAEAAGKKITDLIFANKGGDVGSVYTLQPLGRIRLHAVIGSGQLIGTIRQVYTFSLLAVVVLLIACINFMNLSTARSADRAHEIGLRKVVGAQRGNILRQFYGESFLFTLSGLLIAIFLVVLLLPVFNSISGKSISFSILLTRNVILAMAGVTAFAAFVSGSYPALLLSGFQPIRVLRGHQGSGRKKSYLRKSLVVLQFSLTIFLLIGTLAVFRQVHFMKNKDLGYDHNNLILIPMRGEIGNHYSNLKYEWEKFPGIAGVTAMSRRPTMISDYIRKVSWQGKDPDQDVQVIFCSVEFDFVKTLNLKIKQGRDFSLEFPSDRKSGMLINQEVAGMMGKDNPVGEKFEIFGFEGTIIGVVEDFHFQPLRNGIQPLVLFIAPNPNWLGNVVVRLHSENIPATLDFMKESWKQIVPDYPFEMSFLDEDFDLIYNREERMGELLSYFSFLAIFVACLGLFGLASYTAEIRTKEIGIRRVLGASIFGITISLCKEFAWLVVLSNLMAWPVAYLASVNWLNNFAYRINPGIWMFLLAGIGSFAVAVLTVSFQSAKAARANPAHALKYE